MRAALITSFAGPDAVTVQDVAEPVRAEGEVVIDVEYAGVSFPDVLQTRGEYQLRPALPFVPGWEVAGIVREGNGGFHRGDRVAAMPIVGGFAQRVAAPSTMTFALPESVPLDVAAAVPLNYLTAEFALRRRGRLQHGETVLVHGAAGGVGSATCQLAAALGARVIAVVSTPEKGDVARQSGAHHVVTVDGFRDQVRSITGQRGVDVVVDPVGGDRFVDSLRCLAPEGRLLVVGFAGRDIPTVKVNRLLLTNTSVTGVAVAEMWAAEPGYVQEQWQAVRPLLESGAISPRIGAVHSLNHVSDALREVDERRSRGKVVLAIH